MMLAEQVFQSRQVSPFRMTTSHRLLQLAGTSCARPADMEFLEATARAPPILPAAAPATSNSPHFDDGTAMAKLADEVAFNDRDDPTAELASGMKGLAGTRRNDPQDASSRAVLSSDQESELRHDSSTNAMRRRVRYFNADSTTRR
jgi:hypothetical protein